MAVKMTIDFNRTNRTFRCAVSRQPQGISSCKGPFLGSSREFAGGVYRNDWIIRVQSFLEWIQVIYISKCIHKIHMIHTYSWPWHCLAWSLQEAPFVACSQFFCSIYFHILYCIRISIPVVKPRIQKLLSDWIHDSPSPSLPPRHMFNVIGPNPWNLGELGSIGEIGRKRSIRICRYICEKLSFSCFRWFCKRKLKVDWKEQRKNKRNQSKTKKKTKKQLQCFGFLNNFDALRLTKVTEGHPMTWLCEVFAFSPSKLPRVLSTSSIAWRVSTY